MHVYDRAMLSTCSTKLFLFFLSILFFLFSYRFFSLMYEAQTTRKRSSDINSMKGSLSLIDSWCKINIHVKCWPPIKACWISDNWSIAFSMAINNDFWSRYVFFKFSNQWVRRSRKRSIRMLTMTYHPKGRFILKLVNFIDFLPSIIWQRSIKFASSNCCLQIRAPDLFDLIFLINLSFELYQMKYKHRSNDN